MHRLCGHDALPFSSSLSADVWVLANCQTFFIFCAIAWACACGKCTPQLTRSTLSDAIRRRSCEARIRDAGNHAAFSKYASQPPARTPFLTVTRLTRNVARSLPAYSLFVAVIWTIAPTYMSGINALRHGDAKGPRTRNGCSQTLATLFAGPLK